MEAGVPLYTYLGPAEAYFPRLGRTLAPGDTAELDDDPGDGRWTLAAPASPAPAPTAPAVSPATTTPPATAAPSAPKEAPSA